jgi:DNA-binding transcriptional MocR family regulator
MPKTSPQLVFSALAALVAGRKICGDLPSYVSLARSTGASRDTIYAAVGMLRGRGYVRKRANGRGHEITTPERLKSSSLLAVLDELERVAGETDVTFEDLTAILASRMLLPRGSEEEDDDGEKVAIIRRTSDVFRARERLAPVKTSNRPPSKRERADAARDELDGLHPTGTTDPSM